MFPVELFVFSFTVAIVVVVGVSCMRWCITASAGFKVSIASTTVIVIVATTIASGVSSFSWNLRHGKSESERGKG